MNQPDISVIIVSYNVKAYLQACIKSVLQQENISIEIIVVDNNSSDNTVDMLRQNFPSVKVIANTENKGFSGANNQGIQIATGKNILLLNPDTEIKQRDCLPKLSKNLEENKEGIVAPCLLNTDKSYQPSFWKIIGVKELFYELFLLHKLVSPSSKPAKPVYVGAVSGAAILLAKGTIERIGLMDENMFWMEDIDLCYRIRKNGGKVLYNPECEIMHHGGKSSSNYSIVIPNQILSKIKFYKKHGTFLQYTAMNTLSFIFIVSRIIVFTLLSVTLKNYFRQKAKAYMAAFKWYMKYIFLGNNSIAR